MSFCCESTVQAPVTLFVSMVKCAPAAAPICQIGVSKFGSGTDHWELKVLSSSPTAWTVIPYLPLVASDCSSAVTSMPLAIVPPAAGWFAASCMPPAVRRTSLSW